MVDFMVQLTGTSVVETVRHKNGRIISDNEQLGTRKEVVWGKFETAVLS